MIKIDNGLLENVIAGAESSCRNRQNFNFHEEAGDLLQRMLNAFEPNAYVCPHKHDDPDKREVFIILEGRLLFVEFDDVGKVVDHVVLDRNAGKYAVEVAPKVWHTVIALEKGTVVYEIKDGPYDVATDKKFAPWAPKEGEAGARAFQEKILKELLD